MRGAGRRSGARVARRDGNAGPAGSGVGARRLTAKAALTEGVAIKSLFLDRSFTGYKALVFGLLSLVLLVVDQATHWAAPARSVLHTAVAPVYVVAELPYALAGGLSHSMFALRENQRLRGEVLSLSVTVQRNAALSAENRRLRALLGSTARLDSATNIAEIVGVVADPRTQALIVDRGRDEGVRVGLPVLDAGGLIGQVTEVGLSTARVLMITDPAHATPVEINRTAFRGVAHGTGPAGALELAHVPHTADVREGDLLVTSGLGQRFPPGYPVAIVARVRHDSGKPFAMVEARPSARLGRGRHVVLLSPGERSAPRNEADVEVAAAPAPGRQTPRGARGDSPES